MLPATLTSVAEVERKKEAFTRLYTGDHRADVESWHDEDRREEEEEEEEEEGQRQGHEHKQLEKKKKKKKKKKRAKAHAETRRQWKPFFAAPPELTERQQQLYGLRPYER